MAGTVALAAWGLTACATLPDPVTEIAIPRETETALRELLDASNPPVVAGEALDLPLLRRFYARRGFEPVWPDHQDEAEALIRLVLRARDHGLDPELFLANLLWRREGFPPLRRELLVTHAVLTFAEALAHGAVPPTLRGEGQTLAPEPVDAAAMLDRALDSADPVAAIEALAPATADYRALRQALARHRPTLPAGDRLAAQRLRQIEVNLERQRWLPRALPADRAWVNIADQRVFLVLGGEAAFTSRVVVGENTDRTRSPELRTAIEAAFFNPPWIIPRDIVEAQILPRLERDPDYLTRQQMVLRDNGEIEQAPGPEAGLGVIMFDMPNRFDVYLHDTPNRGAFALENRRLSNGCIRVENPLEFAALAMRRPVEAIHEGLAEPGTTRHPLPAPLPIFLVYQTAFADAQGGLQFRPDFYDRDPAIWRQLQRQGRFAAGQT